MSNALIIRKRRSVYGTLACTRRFSPGSGLYDQVGLDMQIDLDYLKRLLEAFAAAPGPLTDIQELGGRGVTYRDPQFVFHMELLDDERLIARDDRAPGFGLMRGGDGTEMWSVHPLRLTADGHELLEGLRGPRIWERKCRR